MYYVVDVLFCFYFGIDNDNSFPINTTIVQL